MSCYRLKTVIMRLFCKTDSEGARKKMLNNRISRGRTIPLIFRECEEVDAKGIFKISLLAGVLLNN